MRILLLTLLISISAAAQERVILLRGQDNAFCDKIAQMLPDINCSKIVRSETREFDNGNTFVQFQDPVRDSRVTIFMPETLDANQWMETLIKIRTAKSMGASRVTVVGRDLVDASRAEQLAIAGATRLITHKDSKVLKEMTLKPKSPKSGRDDTERSNVIVYSETHSGLAAEIAEKMNVQAFFDPVDLERELRGKKRRTRVIMIESIAPPVNGSLFATLDNARSLTASGVEVALVTPYFPYSRSDKRDQFGVSVTGRLIADMIEAAGVKTMGFARLHAPQAEGFFRIPTVHTSGRKTLIEYLQGQNLNAVISPDAGFQKEASLYADGLKMPVFVLNKQRDPKTGKSQFKKMGSFRLKGMTVAIIDDETASGGTLGEAAEFLKKCGAAKVIGVVTHLAGNAKKALSSAFLDEVVVTNTLPVTVEANPKLKVLSIAPEMAEDLYGLLSSHLLSACAAKMSSAPTTP